MSVEARELISDHWTKWQGHLVDGVYPLGRLIHGAEHSGVFLTRSRSPEQGDAAIKLMPASDGQVDHQARLWAKIGELSHPHLLTLLDSGACHLDGMPYLYVVMEYAGQTLEQLLSQRALTPDEAREMLPPILEALTFLHDREYVQGALKPANVLVVGDQLKLASDTIRRAGDDAASLRASSPYSPPESQSGVSSTPGDIWGLGATLLEGLSRRLPSTAGNRATAVLPADFPPEFREVVERCLSHKPQYRPDVRGIAAWVAGQPLMPAPDTRIARAAQPPARALQPVAASTVPTETVIATPRATPPSATLASSKARFPFAIAAVGILALGALGVGVFRSHSTADAPAPSKIAELAPAISTVAPPSVVQPPAAAVASSAATDNRSATSQRFASHEVIPNVSKSAAKSIRGTVRVLVRTVVSPSGNVSSVALERSAPSKYFQRIALQAAKSWKFRPDSAPARAVEIDFAFTRDGTTARAIQVH